MLDLPRNLFKQPPAKPKILLVEDEQSLREAFTLLLESEHFPLESAPDGVVALKKLRIFKPDIILLDLLMPRMDGIEFLQRADLRNTNPACKIVIMSNLSDMIRPREVARYNVKKVIIKANMAPSDLLQIISRLSA